MDTKFNPKQSRVCQLINRSLTELTFTVSQFCDRLNNPTHYATYEHVRKITRGITPPSYQLLRPIAAALNIDYKKLDEAWRFDKAEHIAQHEFRGIMTKASKYPANLLALTPHWDELTPDQQKQFGRQIREAANQNVKLQR